LNAILNTVLIIGAVQALFFSLILLKKQGRIFYDEVLVFWLLLLCLHLTINFLQYEGYYETYPHLIGVSSSFTLLYGPLLYFYVDSYISKKPKFKNKYLLHLTPFILYNIMMLPFYVQTGTHKLVYFQESFRLDPPGLFEIFQWVKAVTIPAYIIWIFVLLKQHVKNISQYLSFTDQVDLAWIKYLVYSVSVIAVFIVGFKIYDDNNFEPERYLFAAVSIWIFGIGYYGIRQTPVFSNAREIKNVRLPSRDFKKKIIEKLTKANYKETLIDYMRKEKPYLKSKLTIDDIANDLNIPTHHLSLFLNEAINKNFFDFINSFRIQEFKQRLIDPNFKQLTILGIALDCGFNSKASLNRIFKSQTGQTPSRYLKAVKDEVE